MGPLTEHQLLLLERAGGDVPLWGGSTALDWLQRDVELLLAMGMLEPGDIYPYRLSEIGVRALASHNENRRPNPTRPREDFDPVVRTIPLADEQLDGYRRRSCARVDQHVDWVCLDRPIEKAVCLPRQGI